MWGALQVARPDLCARFAPSPPTCSRVGFYVNTFQSIAGLEENFHKEMSKVGLATAGGLGVLPGHAAACAGPGQAQRAGPCALCPAAILHAPVTTESHPLVPVLGRHCHPEWSALWDLLSVGRGSSTPCPPFPHTYSSRLDRASPPPVFSSDFSPGSSVSENGGGFPMCGQRIEFLNF